MAAAVAQADGDGSGTGMQPSDVSAPGALGAMSGSLVVSWPANPVVRIWCWYASGTRRTGSGGNKKTQVADLGLNHGAGDENRTRALSLGS